VIEWRDNDDDDDDDDDDDIDDDIGDGEVYFVRMICMRYYVRSIVRKYRG